MKQASTIILLLLLLSPKLISQELDLSWIDQDSKSKVKSLKSKVRPSTLDLGPSTAVGSEYDWKYARLLFTVDPAEHFITGSIMNYFRMLTEPPHSLTFDMHDSLIVNNIRYHNTQLTTYTHENNILTINLPDAMAYGTLDSIMIDYQGAPANADLGSFTTTEHEGVPLLSTLSEPYGAKDWWPCKQDLNDKLDSVLLVVTCPEAYRTASIGVLIAEDTCNGNRVMQWKHDHPIAAYLVAIAVTNYEVYSDYLPLDNGDSLEILNYVYPENLDNIKSKTPGILEVFNIFNEKFGMYPYADEKYGHAQWEWGGGMEHQTMSFMGSFGHDLMAHELAHQWFGDYITCASWGDIWLNEGFATYLTGITYESMFKGQYWAQFKSLSIDRILKEEGGSVFCTDTIDEGRIFDARLSYSKGGMVLHSLRGQIGDEAFFRGMKNYLNTYGNSYASTKDFRMQMETAADTTLQEFFNDWVYGEGYPTYQYTYTQDQFNKLEIILYQTQSHESVDFFEMKVPITLKGLNTDTTIWVHNTHNAQSFILNPDEPINEVLIDQERWIITRNPVIVGIKDLRLKTKDVTRITIFPNPASNQLTISIPVSPQNQELRILDQQGRTVVQKTISAGENNAKILLDHLPAGVYFVVFGGEVAKLVHY